MMARRKLGIENKPGLGAVTNCPGSPGCPDYVPPSDTTQQIQDWGNALAAQIQSLQDNAAPAIDPTWLLIGGAVILAAVLFGGRR